MAGGEEDEKRGVGRPKKAEKTPQMWKPGTEWKPGQTKPESEKKVYQPTGKPRGRPRKDA